MWVRPPLSAFLNGCGEMANTLSLGLSNWKILWVRVPSPPVIPYEWPSGLWQWSWKPSYSYRVSWVRISSHSKILYCIAQVVEQRAFNSEVLGSSPSACTSLSVSSFLGSWLWGWPSGLRRWFAKSVYQFLVPWVRISSSIKIFKIKKKWIIEIYVKISKTKRLFAWKPITM